MLIAMASNGDVSSVLLQSIPDNSEEQGFCIKPEHNLKEYLIKLEFSLQDLFKLGVKFFKEKEGSKALRLSYNDRVKLVGLIKQASYGKFCPEASADVGFLDVVGNDRNQYWQSLGDMSVDEAMESFLSHLMSYCPQFVPYVEAHKVEKMNMKLDLRSRDDDDDDDDDDVSNDEDKSYEAMLKMEEKKLKEMKLKKQIKDCLNQQTAIQYRLYAKQQIPDNEEEQEALIAQLQEQHFEQYLEQVHSQQLIHQRQQFYQLRMVARRDLDVLDSTAELILSDKKPSIQFIEEKNETGDGDASDEASEPCSDPHDSNDFPLANEDLTEYGMPPLLPASLWTRSDIQEFKASVRKNLDNIIRVASLSTATVKVPTHENGTSIFWEFATDNYDIGFGVYFEWTLTPPEDVTVQASESSGEEDGDEDGELVAEKTDVEKGNSSKRDCGPPMDEIIQIYRRDCHEEVYCGSHTYPGRGVYHLKFDNSYSLWRSKTVYYKVFYSQ